MEFKSNRKSEIVKRTRGLLVVDYPKYRHNQRQASMIGLASAVNLLLVVMVSSKRTVGIFWKGTAMLSVRNERFLQIRGGFRRNNNKPKQEVDAQEQATKSSMTASVFNLVNNVAGAGLLALSAGQAAGTGWIPAIVTAIILGALSAHSFVLIGQACEWTGESDFKGLWSQTLGSDTTWIVDGIVATLCFASAVIYAGILGDVSFSLLGGERRRNIVLITGFILYPLSLLKNLSALAFTSILGFASILYTVLFATIRAVDGTYKLGSGFFLITDGKIPYTPSFRGSSLWKLGFSSLILISNYGLAYVAHYNGPAFYRELRNTCSRRFRTMVRIAYTILIGLYILTMAAGYYTFGDNCQGNILNNYHPDDPLALLGRAATGLSILFGFPLVAAGAREGFQNVALRFGHNIDRIVLVTSILGLACAIACTVSDVSLVVGLTGAALGSFICYVCPSLIYVKAAARKGLDGGWNKALIPFGVAIATLGVYMTLSEIR